MRSLKKQKRLQAKRQAPKEFLPRNVQENQTVDVFLYLASTQECPENSGVVNREKLQALIEATKNLRSSLCKSSGDALVCYLVNQGGIKEFMNLLSIEDDNLQAEITWILTNVTASYRVQDGAIAHTLSQLICNKDLRICEHAVLSLGNMIESSPDIRRQLLRDSRFLMEIAENVMKAQSESIYSANCWLCAKFHQFEPKPSLQQSLMVVVPIIETLKKAVECGQHANEVLSDALWAVHFATVGAPDVTACVLQAGALLPITEIIVHNKNIMETEGSRTTLLVIALKCLGNFTNGSESQVQGTLECGFLSRLASPLLKHKESAVRCETAKVVANIAGGGSLTQIREIIKTGERFALMRRLLLLSEVGRDCWEVRCEALHAVSNVICHCSREHIRDIVQLDAIRILVENLRDAKARDKEFILVALAAIEKVLQVNMEYGLHYVELIEENGGLEAILDIQQHPSYDVFFKAEGIISQYLSDASADQNLDPVNLGNEYEFRPPKQLFAGLNHLETELQKDIDY